MKPNYCLYSANSRALQLWKQQWQTIYKRGTHICLICQRIITEPITSSERGGREVSRLCMCLSRRRGEREERKSVYSQHGSALQAYAQAPRPPGNQSRSGQPETHDVILREHGLPAVSEKVYKTQSQHHTIIGVNCIYSWTAVVD